MLIIARSRPQHTPLPTPTLRLLPTPTRSTFLRLPTQSHPRPFTTSPPRLIGGEPTNLGARITRELLRGNRPRGRDIDPVYKADIERGWIQERVRRQRLAKEQKMSSKVTLGGKTAQPVVPMDAKQEGMVKSLKKSLIQDGWFHERHAEQWPGQAMSLEVAEVLHAEQSLFQEVLVFRSTHHGNVLVLDGAIQCVEDDEFAYQEMIAHLAMMSHPNPKKVLVVGGGDGGVLREVLKHKSVETAELCDIDEAVIRLSKTYLPDMAKGFSDPRVKVTVGDGIDYVKQRTGEYDVIITDSSDPDGPANGLFDRAYFESLHNALRDGGVITTQAENQYLHMGTITSLFKLCKDIFPVVEYAYTMIPTYPSGQIGFMVCSKDKSANPRTPLRTWSSQQEVDACRYYNKEIHAASFVLPNFTLKALGKTN